MKVHIDLSPGQTAEDAEELLLKALVNKRENSHSEEFDDPKVEKLCKLLEKKHAQILNSAMSDVMKVINSK